MAEKVRYFFEISMPITFNWHQNVAGPKFQTYHTTL